MRFGAEVWMMSYIRDDWRRGKTEKGPKLRFGNENESRETLNVHFTKKTDLCRTSLVIKQLFNTVVLAANAEVFGVFCCRSRSETGEP
jgi:hypothetical protein